MRSSVSKLRWIEIKIILANLVEIIIIIIIHEEINNSNCGLIGKGFDRHIEGIPGRPFF